MLCWEWKALKVTFFNFEKDQLIFITRPNHHEDIRLALPSRVGFSTLRKSILEYLEGNEVNISLFSSLQVPTLL